MDRILSIIIELLLPLRNLDSPERIKGLLEELGYALPEGILPPDSPLDFKEVMSRGLELAVDLQTAGTWQAKLAALQEAESMVRTVWEGANSLQTSLNTAFQSIPQFLSETDFQDTFPKRLIDYLVIKYLRRTAPRTSSILELIGVSSAVAQGKNLAQFQSECVLQSLHLDRISELIQSPMGLANELYDWESQFDSNLFLGKLSQVMRMFGLAGNLLPDDSPAYKETPQAPDPARQLFFPLLSGGSWPNTYWQFGIRVEGYEPGGNQKKGLAIVQYAEGEAGGSVSLGDGLQLNLSLSSGLENGIGIFLRPPAALEVQKDLFSQPIPSTDVEMNLELTYSGAEEKIVLLGSADQSHLAANELSLKAGLASPGGDRDLYLELDLPNWSLVVDAGEGDNFIKTILAALPLEIDGSLRAGYYLSKGFYIDSAAGLSLLIPLNKTLGPFYVNQLLLSMALNTSMLQIDSTLTGSIKLGPFELVLDNIGMRSGLDWDADQGLLGNIDIYFKFRPPDGVGIALDIEPVSGGGMLYIDPDSGGYAGALELQILTVGISAFGLINTGLPGGGWSLFFALYIDMLIPLGFGFTLNGVGGVAGVNRTLDVEGLQSAIRSGSLDSVLFPEYPIQDAPLIFDAVETIFPPAEGRYVFGPVIKIGWGTPTLIEAEVGIVIELPDPIKIAVLGSVTSVLPTRDVDLVALHLEVAGVIDTGACTLSIDSSLHDSHIVGFPLSGDMALRSAFGDEPTFLMALGGSHPGFDQPDKFPEIDRLSLAINAGSLIDIRFDCYFALSSNSLQFGADFEMTAEVEGFGINGGASFDALIIFSPFSLQTDLGFQVSVKAFGVDLIGVWLDVKLSAPNPWHVVGTATFTILGIDNSINLNQIIGSKEREEPSETEDVLGQLRAAVALPEAWSVAAGGGGDIVFYAHEPPNDELIVTPDGKLGVSQKVVPLGIIIDKSVPWQIEGGYNWFDIEADDESGMASTGSLTEWFVVSSYTDLSPRERLSAPSFELLKSGIEFGGGDPTAGNARLGTLDFEHILRDPELDDATVELLPFSLSADLRADVLAEIATGQVTRGFSIANDSDAQIEVVSSVFSVTDRLTGAVLSSRNRSWMQSRLSSAGRKEGTTIVPAWEVSV
jgi:hypothetical protein